MNNAKLKLSLVLGLLGPLPTPAGASAATVNAVPGIPWPGASVRLELSGFQARTHGVASLGGARVRFRVDSRGRATVVVRIPASARRGRRALRVRAGARTVSTTLSVVPARRASSRMVALSGGQRVLLDPSSGRTGDRFSLRATGFSRRSTFDVRFGGEVIARHRPRAEGNVTIVGSVPAIAPGTRIVRVASGRTVVSLPFRVLNPRLAPPPVPPAGLPSPGAGASSPSAQPAPPPAVSITAPVSGATLTGTPVAVMATATATDDGDVSGVQFRLDGNPLGAEDTTAPYSTTWNTTTARDGGHTLTAAVRGAAGTTATSNAVAVTVDNAPPTVSVTAPGAGATLTRASAPVTVTAAASDNIGVTGVQFRLDDRPLGAEDTSPPYSTTWNSRTASNGTHRLSAIARDAVSFTTSTVRTVTVDNRPPPGSVVIAAAGDIACSPNDPNFNGGLGTGNSCRQKATSDLLVGRGYSDVLTLGDTQYDCGTPADYAASFDPTWGRFKSIIHPATGNHEYKESNPDDHGVPGCLPDAGGYFGYFGAAAGDPDRGYYSFDAGSWHIIALNTNLANASSCPVVSCAAGSAQEQWLRADLAANPSACTLAFWHHPRFSSKTPSMASRPFWDDLHAAGAEIVLGGHVHNYERFRPQSPAGNDDPARGIAQFVVGTGGKSLESTGTPAPNSAATAQAFGVLQLTLSPTSYEWQFMTEAGQALDGGSADCH